MVDYLPHIEQPLKHTGCVQFVAQNKCMNTWFYFIFYTGKNKAQELLFFAVK